jgi:hypothetical protein
MSKEFYPWKIDEVTVAGAERARLCAALDHPSPLIVTLDLSALAGSSLSVLEGTATKDGRREILQPRHPGRPKPSGSGRFIAWQRRA